jgi:hypothetical protein
MTRKDAIFFWNGPRSNNNCDETNDMAIAALRGPVPDPATGLVPCGCGGKPMLANTGDPKYPVAVQCRQCYVSTDETCDIEHAVHDWNLAMGYRG